MVNFCRPSHIYYKYFLMAIYILPGIYSRLGECQTVKQSMKNEPVKSYGLSLNTMHGI